jgi:hypothetical protein
VRPQNSDTVGRYARRSVGLSISIGDSTSAESLGAFVWRIRKAPHVENGIALQRNLHRHRHFFAGTNPAASN